MSEQNKGISGSPNPKTGWQIDWCTAPSGQSGSNHDTFVCYGGGTDGIVADPARYFVDEVPGTGQGTLTDMSG